MEVLYYIAIQNKNGIEYIYSVKAPHIGEEIHHNGNIYTVVGYMKV